MITVPRSSERGRTTDDRGSQKRTASVEGVGYGLPVHQEVLVLSNDAASLPDGKQVALAIMFAYEAAEPNPALDPSVLPIASQERK